MNSATPEPLGELALARAAATRYAASVGLPPDQVDELKGPPLSGPVDVERAGTSVVAYRWLGGGRGAPYLQVELDRDAGVVTIYGGANHQDREPAIYPIEELGA